MSVLLLFITLLTVAASPTAAMAMHSVEISSNGESQEDLRRLTRRATIARDVGTNHEDTDIAMEISSDGDASEASEANSTRRETGECHVQDCE